LSLGTGPNGLIFHRVERTRKCLTELRIHNICTENTTLEFKKCKTESKKLKECCYYKTVIIKLVV
jgi:hypothetical protein